MTTLHRGNRNLFLPLERVVKLDFVKILNQIVCVNTFEGSSIKQTQREGDDESFESQKIVEHQISQFKQLSDFFALQPTGSNSPNNKAKSHE